MEVVWTHPPTHHTIDELELKKKIPEFKFIEAVTRRRHPRIRMRRQFETSSDPIRSDGVLKV